MDASGTFTNIDAGALYAELFFSLKAYHYFSVPIQDAGGNANSSLFSTSANGNFNPNLLAYDETVDLGSPNPVYDEQELVAGWVYLRPYSGNPNVNLHSNTGYTIML